MPVWDYRVLHGADGRPIVVAVHSADTIRLVLDAGCDAGLFPWLRVAGVLTPGLRDRGGPEATAYTVTLLAAATDIHVTVRARSMDRWVADVTVDGSNLASSLVAAGHGTEPDRGG